MSNKVKLIIGIVLIILMIPVTGVVVVKDNMRNSSYCAGCHEDHYVSYTEPEEGYSLSHFHGEMGVSCQSCHQRTLGESVMEVVNYVTGNYYYPFPESTLSMDNCFACHESYDNVIALTSTSLTHAERNPHDGHFGALECNECHNSHRDSEVYCDQCHAPYFEEAELGWVGE